MLIIRKAVVAAYILFSVIFIAYPIPANPQRLRSFDEIFSGLEGSIKLKTFSEAGFKRSFERHESQNIIPDPDSGIDLFSVVIEKKPSHFIEALLVIPYKETPLEIHDAYNALGRISDIKNHSYYNRNQNTEVQVFEISTRIESAKNNKPVPDPLPSRTFPAQEEIFLHIKDRYFGNIYVRGDLYASRHGITFNLTNFKAIRLFVFPIMRAEKFCAILYLEPLEEGMLIYGMAAVDIPDFIASRINIPSSVERRLNIFIDWLKNGLSNTK